MAAITKSGPPASVFVLGYISFLNELVWRDDVFRRDLRMPMSANGMVRPCSCHASDRSWRGAPKTRRAVPFNCALRMARSAGWRLIFRTRSYDSDAFTHALPVHVRRRVDAWGRFGPPKSKAGKRDIPIPPIVSNALREWKLACPNGAANLLDLVFPSPSGGVLAHACILKDGFHPLQVAAGLPVPKYGLHALRHAAVSLWIEQGMLPKRIQLLAGHSSIRVTFDIYGKWFKSDEADQAAMAEIEARLLR